LLTGKYSKDRVPENSRFANEATTGFFPVKRMTEEYFTRQEKLQSLAAEENISLANLALAWILDKAPVSSVITGASAVAQVEENVAAAEISLSGETIERIEAIMENAPADQYSGARIGYGVVKKGY
jgi:aryl-alcohol dehydrogenase-like predicted oxidoreductase